MCHTPLLHTHDTYDLWHSTLTDRSTKRARRHGDEKAKMDRSRDTMRAYHFRRRRRPTNAYTPNGPGNVER